MRQQLESLDLEQLRDVVAQYGMDRARLAMKWKDKDRLVGLIADTVAARATKGDAFRTSPSEKRLAGPDVHRQDQTTSPGSEIQ